MLDGAVVPLLATCGVRPRPRRAFAREWQAGERFRDWRGHPLCRMRAILAGLPERRPACAWHRAALLPTRGPDTSGGASRDNWSTVTI
jgi:hypothetical protein